EHLQHGVARLSVNLNAGCRLERLSISARCSLRDDVHVKLHRRGVGMDLNDPDFGAVLVRVFVERQELRLSVLDEGAQVSRAVALGGELAVPESVSSDEDE